MSCVLRNVGRASRRHFPKVWRLYHKTPSYVTNGNGVHVTKTYVNHGSSISEGSRIQNARPFTTLSINNKTISEVSRENADTLLSRYDTIMMDCDGVLWQIDHVTPIPGIPQTMNKLRGLGKQILFVTNNSIPGRDAFVDKFQEYGFQGSFEEVFTVSYAAAVYLKNVAKIQRSVYAIGTPGMEFELKQMGLKYYGFGPETDEPTRDNEKLLNMKLYDDVDAVLVGFDEYFDYVKMYKAASYLTNQSCLYIATNSLEGSILIGPNRRQPITASFVKAVTVAAKREPTVVGKPDMHMYRCIKAMFPDIDKSRTLFIGDSLKADIGFAKRVGIDSVLVLTGSSSLATIEQNPGLEPDYILNSLADLGSQK